MWNGKPPYIHPKMAKAFGVVAGAASLAIVLVEKAIKIKCLLGRIKDAPVTVNRAQRELQILEDTLLILENLHRKQPDLMTSTLNERMTSICRELLDELTTFLNKLEKSLDGRPKWSWASFKAALK